MAGKKKAPEAPPARDDAKFQSLVNSLKAKYPGHVFRGNEYTMPWLLRRLPTGVTELDIAVNGGFPAGGITMLVGPEGVGKNWLSNQVIAQQQRFFGDACRVACVSLEMPYDKLFARECGVQVSLSPMEIRAVEAAEQERQHDPAFRLPADMVADLQRQVGEFIVLPPDTAERSLDITCELVASREFNVIVIDSFGSMLTELEQEKDLADPNRPGGAALLNTAFARRMNAATAPDAKGMPNLTTVIGINQARANMKKATPYSPDWIEGGGYALKHARWLSIMLKRTGSVNRKVGDKLVKIGKTIEWEIAKQKAGGHEGKKGTYDFIWDLCGTDPWVETLRCAKSLGILSVSGAWHAYGNTRSQGLDGLADALRPLGQAALDDLREKCFAAAEVSCSWTGEPWVDPAP